MMGSITLSRPAIKLRRQQPLVQEQVATKALKWPLVAEAQHCPSPRVSEQPLHLSAPMCPPCPQSPPAPPSCQTAGVSGSRTGTARITASAALTDAQTRASGPHSLPHQSQPRSLRSRHSHSQTTHLASAMVSCSRRLVSDTVSLTLTSLPRHLLSLHPLSLQLRARPRLLRPHHPRQHQHLRHRVPRRDHGRQMSRNRNPNRVLTVEGVTANHTLDAQVPWSVSRRLAATLTASSRKRTS